MADLQEVLNQLDMNPQDRAEKLMEHAEKGVKNPTRKHKAGTAISGWGWGLSPTGEVIDLAENLFTTATITGFTNVLASAFVATGAVATFAIAPGVGLVVGWSVSKGISEGKYQKASRKLRSVVQENDGTSGGPLAFDRDDKKGLGDLAMLGSALQKVRRKLSRVQRRRTQLGGGVKGAWAKVRHAKTAIRGSKTEVHNFAFKGFSKDPRKWISHEVRDLSRLKGPSKIDDPEYNRRLIELRYYGQATFNYVTRLLEHALRIEEDIATKASNITAHIVRQVHFTGNHNKCVHCYSLSSRALQFKLLVAMGADYKQDTQKIADHRDRPAPASMDFKQLGEKFNVTGSKMNLDSLVIAVDSDATQQGILARAGRKGLQFSADLVGDVVAQAATAGAAGGKKLKDEYAEKAEKISDASDVFGGNDAFFSGWGVAWGVNQTLSFIGNRLSNLNIRRKVQNPLFQRFVAEGEEMVKDDVAKKDLADTFNHLKVGDAGRVIEKIEWYVRKISDLDDDPGVIKLKDASSKSLDKSIFGSCDEAWQAWRGAHYLLRQQRKLILQVAALAVILLQVDEIVREGDSSLDNGDIIDEKKINHALVRPDHLTSVN